MATTDKMLSDIFKARMGVNPYVSIGAPIAGNIISALVANQARRRAQERLSGLQRPSLPQFRQNPLLSQRIAQQQQLADQPMMGYQRAADEQTARQMESGRQIAAGLGGGAGLAYMQGVSSNVAAQQRQGLLSDMAMQAKNRAELDQLINMRNQEMQQQRAMEGMEYQMNMQDYVRQREGLEADVAQQQGNIGAAIGASVADIPSYVQNFRMYNAFKKMFPNEEPNKDVVNPAMDRKQPAPDSIMPDLNQKASYIPFRRQVQSPVFANNNVYAEPQRNPQRNPYLGNYNPIESPILSRLFMPIGPYDGMSGLYSRQTQSPVFSR
jgi:hypothetical protein